MPSCITGIRQYSNIPNRPIKQAKQESAYRSLLRKVLPASRQTMTLLQHA
jgi:hypothetical protein